MLSKSAARKFFVVGTVLCMGAFVLLTLDTVQRVPIQTNKANLNESAIRGKHLFDKNNCMGCHTILGEGAYYAPELTKAFERRGPDFIAAMLRDPQAMYPGQRKMQKYDFTERDIADLVAFLKWIGEMDLNGFPPKPDMQVGASGRQEHSAATLANLPSPPAIYGQMCTACHSMGGSGGTVGPALDGVGDRLDESYLVRWLKDPKSIKSDALMPRLPLSEEDIHALAKFLSRTKAHKASSEDSL